MKKLATKEDLKKNEHYELTGRLPLKNFNDSLIFRRPIFREGGIQVVFNNCYFTVYKEDIEK